MESDLKAWYTWCAKHRETREFKDIPPDELDCLFGHFFVTVCRKDASLDEPDTLLSFQRSIDRSPHKRSHGVVLLVLDCASILHSLCLLQYIVLVYYYYTPKLSFVMYSPSLTRLWKGCGQVAQEKPSVFGV